MLLSQKDEDSSLIPRSCCNLKRLDRAKKSAFQKDLLHKFSDEIFPHRSSTFSSPEFNY